MEKTRHVLVIVIDGALPGAVQTADTPNVDSLVQSGAFTWNAYSGGELYQETQQATSSGPSYRSILTGVWDNKHHGKDGRFSSPNYSKYPHFFKRIREKFPDAFLSSIVGWKPINESMLSDADYARTARRSTTAKDEQVVRWAVEHLETANPHVLFLQFEGVDGAGHKYGYNANSPGYLSAISKVDGYIGMLSRSISKRPNIDFEDWLTIVTTDHGGKEKGHGGQSAAERSVFLIVCGGDVIKGEINSRPGIVAVPPTVLTHLGIEIDPVWGWNGEAFGYR